MWNFLAVDELVCRRGSPTGARVARMGTLAFVRSGFARVRWDDGRVTDEWLPDLVAAQETGR
jgi:hypothetical protein